VRLRRDGIIDCLSSGFNFFEDTVLELMRRILHCPDLGSQADEGYREVISRLRRGTYCHLSTVLFPKLAHYISRRSKTILQTGIARSATGREHADDAAIHVVLLFQPQAGCNVISPKLNCKQST
jgi:hypothetical protein